MVCATPMNSVTMIRRIVHFQILDAEVVMDTTLIGTRRLRLNYLTKMRHLLNLIHLRRQCRYGTYKYNALHNLFHPRCQPLLSTMRQSAISDWRTTIQQCSVRPFRLNSAPRLSTWAKQISPPLWDACDDTQQIRFADVPRLNVAKHQGHNGRYTPQTYTSYSTAKQSLEHLCHESVCNLTARERLNAKVNRTVAFAPSDRQPEDIVSCVTKSDSSITPCMRRISVTFIHTKTDSQNKTDETAKTNIWLPPPSRL